MSSLLVLSLDTRSQSARKTATINVHQSYFFIFFLNRQILFIDERVYGIPTTRGKKDKNTTGAVYRRHTKTPKPLDHDARIYNRQKASSRIPLRHHRAPQKPNPKRKTATAGPKPQLPPTKTEQTSCCSNSRGHSRPPKHKPDSRQQSPINRQHYHTNKSAETQQKTEKEGAQGLLTQLAKLGPPPEKAIYRIPAPLVEQTRGNIHLR